MNLRNFEALKDIFSLLIPLAILHFFILLFSSNYGLNKYATFGDGAEYINLAKSLSEDPISVIINVHPPFYPILIRIFSILTSYELASLLVNAIFHTLLVIPMYKAAKLTIASNHKVIAIICSIFPPALLTYAGIGLADTLTIFLSSLFFYFLLKRNEKGMIVTGIFAVLTHQIAYLLIIPLGLFYLKRNPWKFYRTFIIAMPFILLSLYRYSKGQSIMYYIDVHFAFAKSYWESKLFSLPFESLAKNMMGAPIKAGGVEYPVSSFSIIYVILLFMLYLGGAIISWKSHDAMALSYGLPFIIFLTFYQVWFFIPRFLSYSFPLLLSYGRLMEKNRFILYVGVFLSIISVIYSLYFLLYAFPLSY